MIDPRHLKVFLAVHRAASITGGARALNMSQPSVSIAISALERAVGSQLFDRSRSGSMLTDEGRILLRSAQAIECLLDDAQTELELAREGIAGPLRVGGTPGALVSLLPDAVRALESRHGAFALHVIERPDDALDAMLRAGEIELAFVTTEIEEPDEGIEELTFSRDPFALIVGQSNDLLPSEISLRDVMDMGWVLPEARGAFRRQIDALFMTSEVRVPADVIRCDSLLTTKAIVRNSARVTILPMKVAAAELSIGVLRAVAIREATFPRSIGVRKLKGGRLSRLGGLLLENLFHEQEV